VLQELSRNGPHAAECVLLEITFSRCHKLLVRAFNFLPDAIVVRHYGGMTWAALLAFFCP
jgi:hypothetical protein